MMAELDASFPKSDETKLRKNFPQPNGTGHLSEAEQRRCGKCNQMPPVCICVDCGGLSLCSECDMMLHKGSSGKSRRRHRTKDLFSHIDDGNENGIAEARLIDFDTCDGNESLSAAKTTSFLLVDGSEKLQVKIDKLVLSRNEVAFGLK